VIQPPDAAASPAALPPGRDVVLTGFAAFLLLGWTVLLVPSIIREIQRAFDQSDAGMGFAYFVNAVVYVTGTVSVGVLAGRLSRRLLLAAGPGLIAVGLLLIAAASDWAMFLAGFLVMGMGAGIIDAGVNALFMDLYAGRAAMLNRLHLFFALGALTVPLVVGLSVGSGAPWQAVAIASAAVAAPLAVLLGTRRLPPTHPEAEVAVATRGPDGRGSGDRRRVPLPLVVLAIAIGCYVAMELGVSSWLVRYLDEAPLEVATLALSLFWASLALGRLVSSFIVDRMGAVAFATTWAAACGVAVLAAINVPSVPLAILCFAIAGFAAGPVYPMILAIGGSLYPGRASMVSSVLTSAAIVGSIVYPPLMGVVSEAAGLWLSMLGAALFAFVAAGCIWAAARLGRARDAAEAVEAATS
jgi:FHS family glucose/mannose:H+ symporter-like MFS transporter